ncbi:two-component system nitrogen regulation response regulator NtrX [Candidatus Pelagibacter ubique]|uniref:Two-component system nitrogen regulation response regulator NtrX n=1 Tax=Pelagibacter ubique TaxID=198252 RepID=A0ABX1T1U2_PELUQ|nr:sigma-54 dependent transcriptional regulator [Candidatus Pelagibacter ubique]NMN68065.1 two-component system nitrogen regulation response regulator NtrX [Candidatus Pelagibacter ubique]
MSTEILIIDDNADIRNIINDLILEAGYKTRLAANYNQALNEIDKKLPDVAIIDVKLDKGDNDGLELLSHIKTKDKNIPVIIITGHANVEMAIKALKTGAFEFIEKPFNQERLLNFINRAVENINLKNENKEFENKLFYSYELVGNSENIKKIQEQIKKISISESRIFINGPTGSGKELIARKIHKESKRQKNPFIILNGALLEKEKYELELFGEEKNNGSISYGALEKSSGGILLIDEISEIPLDTQSKILRVLTDQKFKRINGNHDINVDVRIICSTSKDIKEEIKNGNFREDLYHRLNVFEINIEPLKNRISDIPLLVEYFADKISKNHNLKKMNIDINNNYLLNYNWPGNIRELRNLIERIAILSPNTSEKISNIIKESLKTPDLKIISPESSLSSTLKDARENFEKEYLTNQLKKFNGNIAKTANFVGMERSALHRKLKGLGIKELN